MVKMQMMLLAVALLPLLLTGCATTSQPNQIARISPEELERIIPKAMPNLPVDEIVTLSKQGVAADEIIARIKATGSYYNLTPTDTISLSQKGVSAKVLDYMHSSREQSMRDSFADEINKREEQKRQAEKRLRWQYQSRPYYYDPFWDFGYPRYGFGRPYSGFGFYSGPWYHRGFGRW
ncbi:hypothetical protein ED236_05885 [Pseudomethylobacillus aquaticus]|uniref:DUF3300 domain-containing protein n=1 Tax=Pseudomethylobacillus aquaticus TaxID=2676064 RepID=A0A3N0V338_9PROT|nr:hypothetical protein [Pseudomethylobacillus aquaticus]ROH87200.1 hypothetical protein ED236_05885 [Pseudomethylobacillus aquaticus]